MRSEAIVIGQRIRDGVPKSGNVEANSFRIMRGEKPEPEILSDPDRLDFLRRQINERVRLSAAFDGALQREKAVASNKLCEAVTPEHTALVSDFAAKLSALHAAHTKYVDFLDAVEASGASMSYLRPVWPAAIGHPRDASASYHWTYKEMREHGHITMNQIPEVVR
ncbi:hypothetical protein [Bradyrhizobium sp. CCBAU 11361]|uniref:hypothetical protein n=1 Tax=Bradyrhizobium sp. CCBAU 11361 TaxID=1630812 RepID=UPI0023044C0A|nr:hypothetical protein [Bradyrhizobium sp. CCBAU 11361]MDA9487944.1 hypothetical protein [Bradyrhizobium sp. CCBAU 11361]